MGPRLCPALTLLKWAEQKDHFNHLAEQNEQDDVATNENRLMRYRTMMINDYEAAALWSESRCGYAMPIHGKASRSTYCATRPQFCGRIRRRRREQRGR